MYGYLNTWNMASVFEELNIWFYFILISWLVAPVLDNAVAFVSIMLPPSLQIWPFLPS